MSQQFSKNVFEMAKDDFLKKDDLLKVIRKYHRCKDEAEKDKLRDLVVKNNMRLVIKLANGYANRFNKNPDDLFQNGVIGILVALDKFKPGKRFAFSTYAVYWVENFIRRAIDDDKMINTHRYLSVGEAKTQIYFKAFAESDGDMDKFVTLLRKGGLTRKQQSNIERIISIDQGSSYLDLHSSVSNSSTNKGAGSEMKLLDIIEDKQSNPPDIEALDSITREKLMKCISEELTPMEQLVIRELYFSVKRNVNEVSKRIKKSKPFIMKIEQKAIRKISRAVKGERIFSAFDKAWENFTG